MNKLIIGLGNPGEKYKNNRHNAGHLFVDFLVHSSHFTVGSDIKAFKTETFMNESGFSVVKQLGKLGGLERLGNENIYIAHDDLDLPLGRYKIQFATGPKVHNGLDSVEEQLGTKDFWRIRIGVDNRDPENRLPGESYVLLDFTKEEFETLQKTFEEIMTSLKAIQSKP